MSGDEGDGMNCSACKWSGAAIVEGGLRCIRHAPIVTGGMYGPTVTAWPTVRPNDTCGDFQWPEEKDRYVVPF